MKATRLAIAFCIGALLVYDAAIILMKGTKASVSMQIIEWSYEYPVFTFAVGFIMGHLFWRLKDNEKTKRLGGDSIERGGCGKCQ